jgi:MFS family permease
MGGMMRDALRLLADRRFAFLFSARTISTLGSGISPIALAFAVLDMPGASAATLGLVFAAQYLPEVLFLLVGGVVADRFQRYWVMVGAETAAGLSFGVLAALFLTGSAQLPLVMALAAISGIARAMLWPAFTGIVPQVVPSEKLESANGLLRLSMNSTQVLGIAIAGGLVMAVGPGWALAIDAASFLAGAALLTGVRVPNVRSAGASMLEDLKHGWREFKSRQWLWVTAMQFAVLNAAVTAGLTVLGPLVAKRDLGAEAWSVIVASGALGTVLGVLVAIRIRPSRPMLVAALSMFMAAPPFLLLGLGAPVSVVAAAAFVSGVCLDIAGVLWCTALQRHVPTEVLSRVSSYGTLSSFVLGPLALLAAGPVVALAGIDTALLGCGGLIFVAGALALLSPQVRQLAAHAADAATVG